LVGGETKPAMEFIYEAMDQAKKTMATSFKVREYKYK
jgi:hypothetical protein